jgi:hypothetical protein
MIPYGDVERVTRADFVRLRLVGEQLWRDGWRHRGGLIGRQHIGRDLHQLHLPGRGRVAMSQRAFGHVLTGSDGTAMQEGGA